MIVIKERLYSPLIEVRQKAIGEFVVDSLAELPCSIVTFLAR